jgi:penicillin-binding protein-related factor A (putative recombinase)
MSRKSRDNGERGERLASSWFREHGYWAHITKRNNQGSQPVDLVAIRKKGGQYRALLADVKYVESGSSLPFSDIQPNQVEAMRYAKDFSGIDDLGFIVIFGSISERIMFYHFSEFEDDVRLGLRSKNAALMDTMEGFE